jgi:hypothetical protein
MSSFSCGSYGYIPSQVALSENINILKRRKQGKWINKFYKQRKSRRAEMALWQWRFKIQILSFHLPSSNNK